MNNYMANASMKQRDLIILNNYGATHVINNTIENCDNPGFGFMSFYYNSLVNITDLTLRNNIGSSVQSSFSFIRLNLATGGSAKFNQIKTEGNQMSYFGLISSEFPLKEFNLENSKFNSDILRRNSYNYIDTGTIQSFTMKNVHFSGIKYASDRVVDSYLLTIPSIDLENAYNSTISNLTVDTTDVQIMQFSGFKSIPSNSVYFNINDVTVQDCTYCKLFT
jgi:hypothetical protein